MNRRRIPVDAFSFYLGLGATRSYALVAKQYGVSKQAVVRTAVRENWQSRLVTAEQKVAALTEEKAIESLEAMHERHLKMMSLIQRRALEALRSMPLDSAMDAVRALDLAVKSERVVRGEPGDRSAVDVERVIRGEYERWLTVEGGEKNAGS